MSTWETGFGAWLLESSWQAALLAGLVVLVQLAFGKTLQPRWKYLLWFLVLGRLLLPSVPESPVSMYRYVPASPVQVVEPLQAQFAKSPLPPPALVPNTDARVQASPISAPSISWREILFTSWLIGVGVLLTVFLVRNRAFYRKLRLSGTKASDTVQDLCARLAEELQIRKPITVLDTHSVCSPAVVGLLRPQLLLPEGLASRLSREELTAVLLHELAHVKRGDLWINLLVSLLQIAHWFNPVLWWAFARMHGDRELATDSLALSIASDATRETYGRTLLKLLVTPVYTNSLQPSLGILENHKQLKSRIEQIARFRPRAYAWSLLGILLLVALGAFALTKSPVWKKKNLKPISLFPDEKNLIISDFFNRVEKGDFEVVGDYLDRGLDVNVIDGRNALSSAIYAQNLKMVKFLLSKGARANDYSGWGNAVHFACWFGNKRIADALIAAGGQYRPIIYDAGTGDLPALKKLYAEGGMEREKDTLSALNYAAASGHADVLDWLWKQAEPFGAGEAEKKQKEIFDIAVEWGGLPVIQYLDQHGFDVKTNGQEALKLATRRNHPEIIKYFFDKGVTLPTEKNKTYGMLRFAASEGYIELVRLLIDHGADVNFTDDSGDSVLIFAAEHGHENICRLLIDHGADIYKVYKNGENAAWHAALAGVAPDTLELLIKRGVDVKGVDKKGDTILRFMEGYIDRITGQTALFGKVYTEAESNEYDARLRRTIFLLADAGADLNAQGSDGTPLMMAFRLEHWAIAKALIDKGADVNARDKQGDTALSIAAAGGWGVMNAELIEMLLEKGADIHVRDSGAHPFNSKDSNNRDVEFQTIPTTLLDSTMLSAISFHTEESIAGLRDTIKVLLRHGAQFSVEGNADKNKWLSAVALGDLEELKKMKISHLEDVDASGWNAMNISLLLGFDDITQWLLDQGASVKGVYTFAKGDFDSESPISIASWRQKERFIDLCIARGIDPKDAVLGALDNGNLEMLKKLVKAGADLSRFDTANVIFICIQKGQFEIAKIFLEHGAAPDSKGNPEHRENVYWAIHYNQPEILQMILDRGANPTLETAYKETPLSYAKQARPQMVPMLEAAIKKWNVAHPKA